MQIRAATETDRQVWDAYVMNHPDGLAYQMFGWKLAVERAYGFCGEYFLAEQGGKVCGILPLIDFRIPFFDRRFISLPYCDVGGVLADDERIAERLLDHVRWLITKRGWSCQIRASFQALPETTNRTDKVRMLLDLPENSEQLLAGLRAKVRSQARKPLRDGLTAELGGRELLTPFYKVFAQNMRDLGSPVHSRRWIESVVEYYGNRTRLAVVFSPSGDPAAAGLILLHPITVSIPWASALRKYNKLNPNMLLYWTFLEYAADNGYQRFDFGRSTPGEGTYRFKEQWGAKPSRLFWYELSTAPASAPPADQLSEPSAMRQVAIRLWQKLPVTAANILGPQLRKYISL
jgi:FemAB-related protein (PEP-CTERM system-associated)